MTRGVLPFCLAATTLVAALGGTAAFAGTTGPVSSNDNGAGLFQLLRPQGEGSSSFQGDYVSSIVANGGINGVYHYWIEVPPGLGRLAVDIYDADIGAGNADGEHDEGRDRARGSYESQATYQLFDPSGAGVTEIFTVGDVDDPAGADDTWLTLYNTSGNSVRDNFDTAAYTNNDGNNTWSAAWIETDGGGTGATTGAIQITGGELRLQDNVGGTPSLQREADLLGSPGLGLTRALLTFDFRTSNNLEDGDQISVQVSANGGGSWTTLETFSNDASGSRSYNISAQIANNTRVRFLLAGGYGSGEFFFVDDLQITDDGAPTAGHWELRIDMSGGVDGPDGGTGVSNDDINAVGIRAHDGTSGAGGTELNIYADSATTYGMNGVTAADNGEGADYDFFPYVISGCLANKNEFDFDEANSGGGTSDGSVGDMTFYSRTPASSGAATPPGFSQSFGSSQLSTDDVWRRDTFTGWVASDQESTEYGVWHLDARIEEYPNNSNYTVLYLGAFNVDASAALATNPESNTFRIYLPTDASDFVETVGGDRDRAVAPVKPYLEQQLRHTGCGVAGPNPPQVGQTSCYTVTVRLVNPTAYAITFSSSSPTNLVTVNIPTGGFLYGGLTAASPSHGTVVSQPAIGGTGDITWNPGSGSPTTLAAGETALLSYLVNVTPAGAGARISATGVVSTGAGADGTRATFVDETGNTTQSRATLTIGPLCELAVTECTPPGNDPDACDSLVTAAVVSAFRIHPAAGGGLVVEWETGAEERTSSFRVLRRSKETGRWTAVHPGRLPALQGADQGGVYRLLDPGVGSREAQVYLIEEREPWGTIRRHGPYRMAPPGDDSEIVEAPEGGFSREAHRRLEVRPVRSVSATSNGAPVATRITAPARGSTAAAVRIGVEGSGLVRLPLLDLAAASGTPIQLLAALIANDDIALSRDGAPVAWLPEPLEGTPTALLFHAAPLDSLYSRESAYRLSFKEAGVRMEQRPAATSRATHRTVQAHAHEEEDAVPVTVIGPDPESDYWFYDDFLSGDDAFASTRILPLAAPAAVAGAPASLGVELQGATTYGVAGEHEVDVFLNERLLGTLTWQGIAPTSRSFAVPAGVLLAAGNTIKLVAHRGNGVAESFVYPQAFELFYQRSLETADDSLAFLGDGGSVALGGSFSGPPVALLEIGADPHQPSWLTDRWQPGFTSTRGRRYLAVGPQGLPAPSTLRPWRTSVSLEGTEWLAIVPRDEGMLAAAERLADLRRGQGLVAQVVDLDVVADTHGHGQSTPEALRQFLAAALASDGELRYVALAGDGSLDYRDLFGLGENLVPAKMVLQAGNLFPADLRLAPASEAGAPLLAIGRIPVHDAAELDAWVDKIAAYEEGPGNDAPAWGDRALLLSDDPNSAPPLSFSHEHERLAGRLASRYKIDRIALDGLPGGGTAEARQQLLGAFARGTALMTYLGHGALDRLAAEGLLASSDVHGERGNPDNPGLGNGSRLPLLAALTCTVNRFSVPGVPSLGEELVTAPGGGAAAVIAPSGLADHRDSLSLGEALASRLAAGDRPRLGDVLLDALGEHLSRGGDRSLVDLYNLLGDPGTRLVGQAPPIPGDNGTVGE